MQKIERHRGGIIAGHLLCVTDDQVGGVWIRPIHQRLHSHRVALAQALRKEKRNHDANRALPRVYRRDHLIVISRVKCQVKVFVVREAFQEILALLASFLIEGA